MTKKYCKDFELEDNFNKIIERAIDPKIMYDLTICFANGLKKKPIQIPGGVIISIINQLESAGTFSILGDNGSGIIIPTINVNEIYWEESKNVEGITNNEVEKSIN
ncbi:MAG: hypothetical protein ACFFG0_18895 [Candidatus Thorarchaeota archaeon]